MRKGTLLIILKNFTCVYTMGLEKHLLFAGDYQRALHYHQSELAISEGIADKLGLGIAHRKVGECLSELRSYEPAIQHQMKHLLISKEIGSFMF